MAEDLQKYFEEVLRLLGTAISTKTRFQTESIIDTVAYDTGKLRARIAYEDGSTLQVLLTVDFTSGFPDWIHYSFHFQDEAGRLRFRYDNFRHYLGLPQFPHHKHEGPSEAVEYCDMPSVHQIHAEIRQWLESSAA